MQTRRLFLERLATATGAVVLMPVVSSCGGKNGGPAQAPTGKLDPAGATPGADLPLIQPPGWDPIAYNKLRGNQGAIPESYLKDINGPDGPKTHLGKHLPYVPSVPIELVPEGFIPVMWGDPAKDHARHPNAVRSASNNMEGHWYNWIRVRKATQETVAELESGYSEWPGTAPNDTGAYAAFGGGDIAANDGKDTIYLAALPTDAKPGDSIRIWAHCLTHGEYVDFLTVVPATAPA